ncbi:MAG TPA: pyridoxamine 5'-phosphate oxidase family protein [Bosea sp. (in: a-proteobacteria)]|jgi:general stress protein 26|uniref:pyridoxamine 5'-phosphate oxidase family protein n=1 Tax=Bosea sp. (in: a-proteobacteria) TaxID=1871050 RepID=UPI002E121CD4|nr:pyridoxamine 5'-phosphate oxidase family protein [Bosea sp. (in: a-proteobacteria)]
MGARTLSEIAKKMKDIDFCMLTTVTEGGQLSSGPMSNNRDVDYDGDSWFFAYEDARFIRDVQGNDQFGLTFAGDKSLLGKPGIFIGTEGKASLTKGRVALEQRWVDDMERWFSQGIETPGIVLLKVRASRVHYWDSEEEGEVKVQRPRLAAPTKLAPLRGSPEAVLRRLC